MPYIRGYKLTVGAGVSAVKINAKAHGSGAKNASDSTSQAASIIEAIEAGATAPEGAYG